MSRKGEVILVCVSPTIVKSGYLKRLADQGADLALVVPSNPEHDEVQELRNEVSQLRGPGSVTVHREDVEIPNGFQSAVDSVLSTYGRLDLLITKDGKVVKRDWKKGSDDDRSRLLGYAAFTESQEQRLRSMLQSMQSKN